MKRATSTTASAANLAHPFLSSEYIGKLLTNVVNEMLEGLQIISPDWRYLYVNDTVCKQGKLPREQLVGRTMMECYPGIEKSPLWKKLEKTMKERVSTEFKNVFKFSDGTKQTFLLRIHQVKEGLMILSTPASIARSR